jgi:hypothetical protein
MRRARFIRLALLTVLGAAASAGLFAQAATTQKPKPFEPVVGQAGKDVVWVPTPQPLVEKMLDMAKVTPQDVVMDLGSGDGRTVITAAKRGARAIGVEYNPNMVELSRKNAAAAGVKPTFIQGDLFEADLSQATVITMFLLPDINLKLRPKILDLKPGTRIVTNSFTMAEWEHDETETISEDCTSWCTAYLWYVPAKVDGTWKMGNETLTLTQTFQMVTGTLGSAPVEGKLKGDEITFMAGGAKYVGKVSGRTIQGSSPRAWTASR